MAYEDYDNERVNMVWEIIGKTISLFIACFLAAVGILRIIGVI